MPKFKVIEAQQVVHVGIYEVEAETKEIALDLYINKLAGSLEPIEVFEDNSYDEGIYLDK